MNEYSIAKVGGQYIKCFVNDNGVPQFQLMSEEDVAQANVDDMLEIGGPTTFNSKLAKTIEEAESELLSVLKQNLKENVLALMGFEKDSWGRQKGGWKIDHCNGRMSHVSDYVAVKAREILNTFDPNDFLKDPEFIEGIQRELRTEFKEQYRRQLRRKLDESIERLAQVDANQIVTELARGENMQGLPQEIVASVIGVKFMKKMR